MPISYLEILTEWLLRENFEEIETDEPYYVFQKEDQDGLLKVRISVE